MKLSRVEMLILGLIASIMCLTIIVAGGIIFYSLTRETKKTSLVTVPEVTPKNADNASDSSSGFIKSIKAFEESHFCVQYDCISSSRFQISDGVDNAYTIGDYPVYNEFYIEIVTANDSITEYGMTLDPREITTKDLQFIKEFLTSIMQKEIDPQVLEFVKQNLDNSVSQICYSSSTLLGSMHLWVGMVGLAPTLVVKNDCPK